MLKPLKLCCIKGEKLQLHINSLAEMRIEIFKEYPYLYAVNLEFEMQYLKNFKECVNSVIIVAYDDEKLVGLSTAMPLAQTEVAWQKPFLSSNINLQEVFYLGETVLLPEYRVEKLIKIFFLNANQ